MLNSKTLLARLWRGPADALRGARPAGRGAGGKAQHGTDRVGLLPDPATRVEYAQAIDTCSNSGYDYADLFTADGFFAPFANGQPDARPRAAKRWPWPRRRRQEAARALAGSSRACTTSTSTTSSTPRREGQRHGQHADDRAGRRSEQDRARRGITRTPTRRRRRAGASSRVSTTRRGAAVCRLRSCVAAGPPFSADVAA
jgi:hypothetical protein